MKLHELLKGVNTVYFKGDPDVEISGITYDSRKAKKGDLFICVSGFKYDGHSFIDDALGKGAVAFITEKDAEVPGAAVVKVESSRAAMPVIASNFYGNPSQKLRLIGITGTNGKTTTTYLIKSIMEANKQKIGLLGTITTQIGDKIYISSRTTPEALDLQCLFREMADSDVDYAVMEVSSHSLELGRVEGCNFRIGVFTNLTQDHLDFHKTIENYRNAKKKLFYMVDGTNIINIDDEHGKIIAGELKNTGVRLITYGIDNKADITAKNIDITSNGVGFTIVTPEYEAELNIRIPGKFSVYNALAAAAAAYAEGIDRNIIREGLNNVDYVPGRSEIIKTDTPYTVIVDYAHTPDGLQNILASVKEYAKGRIITLFGCGGDRDKEKRPIMGNVAGRMSDYCIITSDNPRTEDPMDIIRQTEAGIKSTGCDYICIENRRDAIKYAITMAKPGDIVLLAGKGHETYQILKDKTIPFDERDIVQELLREEI
ncbi:MAG: UDP-N-acetylmuramoyl-L-alanyl-D-glutamate--2,6-diaminopimelate ligase [Gracilibacteraceae bacterium]|jgi:UDP-N-acetylmuramoyl-L-alanyl-D-glutamate--2,6-diaminopimelate ligase|nr:UDP-N-acetylmuramoyl-L-alanyl-D-glutamate--2,6-diaminopimelate ligase [Gracilibacteraceae bacterium]